MRVAVVGGGISGLTAAFRLVERGHDVACYESARPGGLIGSERRDGFLCEAGPESLVVSGPEVRGLLDDLGLAGRAVEAAGGARRRFVHLRGKLRRAPSGPLSLLASDALSWAGKGRILREMWIPPREALATSIESDESILDFAARRFGDEAARALAAPAVIGFFAGDAARLSMASAFPRLCEIEHRHGSLLRGLRAERARGTDRPRLVSFPDGLAELPAALAARLGDRLVAARAVRLEAHTGAWRIVADPAPPRAFDAVVLAVPPGAAAALLDPLAPTASSALRTIPLASVAIACLGFRRAAIGVDLRGYGFLVARGSGVRMLGCQYESSVFAGRAPPGQVLLRVVLGGTFHPGAVDEDDAGLVAGACDDLRTAAGLTAVPDVTRVFRHRAVLPQYEVGHGGLVGAVDQALAQLPGLHVIGMGLRGVGLGECIRAATSLAQRLPTAKGP